MTQRQIIEEETIKLLSSRETCSLAEIRNHLTRKGLKLKESSTLIRTTLSSMTSVGKIRRLQRGIYCINPTPSINQQKDSTDFITLLPETNRSTVLAVNILENGHINLNGKLNAQIMSRKITIQFSSSYRQIRLIPDGQNSHTFTKIGTAKNGTLCQELRRHRIALPARYEVVMAADCKSYIGKLIPTL